MDKYSNKIKEINGEKYEVVNYNNKPYMLVCEQGICMPIETPKRVGQKVVIDWKAGDDVTNSESVYKSESYRPKGIPDTRIFIITVLTHDTYFSGYTESDPNKSITEIYWDGRGGWTERGHDGKLCFSHPILTFLDEDTHL